jgi:L-iditol 2-dehydrogenase
MLAVVKSKPEEGIEILEVPKPHPKEDEVLVHVEACGICGTDLHFYEWVDHARWITLPRILGHELVGRVEGVGPRVKEVKIGQRIVTETWGGCGVCYYCRLGRFNSCQNQLRIGQHSDGGMAPYVTLPAISVFPIPDSMDTTEAAVLEPLGVALHALERCVLKPGDDVAILGPGPIGLLATQLVKQSGAGLIFVAGLEKDRQRLDFAEKWGGIPVNLSKEDLTKRIHQMTLERGVDLVLEASGGKGALDHAVQISKPGGQIAVIGLGTPEVFNLNEMVHKEITVHGCWRRQPSSWYRAINLVEQGRMKVGEVVTHILPLRKADEGFKLLLNSQAIKVLLIPED